MEAERRAGLRSWRKARTLLSPQTQAGILFVWQNLNPLNHSPSRAIEM
jgi:hypothetical protein